MVVEQCYQPGSKNTPSCVQGSVNDEFLVKTKIHSCLCSCDSSWSSSQGKLFEISVPKGIHGKDWINTIDLRQLEPHLHKLANRTSIWHKLGDTKIETSRIVKTYFLLVTLREEGSLLYKWSYKYLHRDLWVFVILIFELICMSEIFSFKKKKNK